MTSRTNARLTVALILLALTGCASNLPVNVVSLGAIGDGKTTNTTAFQKALDDCAARGGGQVTVPAGNFVIGSIRIGPNTTLYLSEGATLIGSPDPNDYPIVPVRFEGETVQGHRALISATDADHIAIRGPGTLQGDMSIGDLRRPRAPVMIELQNCHDVRLEDFKDRYRRMWSVHLLFCSNVQVNHLNIRTTKTNGDGIDVDSSTNVTIQHCDIDTGDDAISLKSGRGVDAVKAARPTKDILIKDCVLGSNFAGVGIGTEMSGGISNVRIEHCTFTHGDNAIFLKSRLGRGGFIEGISANTLDSSSKTCLGINLVNKGIVGTKPILGTDGIPTMRNISLENVTIHAGNLVDGSNTPAEKPIDGLSISNVTGTCATGISLANVVNARLSNIHVTGFAGPLLIADNVKGTGLEAAVPPRTAGMTQLHDLFESPPDDARPMVRWWWFGPAVTKPELKREIETMKAGGFGGFEVQPTYPLAVDGEPAGLVNLKFLSPEFLDDLNFTASSAKETGMRMDLTLGSGWPYGGSMFPITEAAGRLKIGVGKVMPGETDSKFAPLRDGDSPIAAFVGNQQLTILNDKMQFPTTAPAGAELLTFTASRTGMKVKRPAEGAEGYVIDHLSLPVVAKFINEIGNKEVEACGSNPPYSVFCDSLEVGGEDWTGNLPEEFQKRRGYDLLPLLPALVRDIGPRTMEIRHDWGQTLTEVFNDSFVKPLRSLAEDHKIRFRIQAYGSPSAGLFSYGDADLPEGEGYQWHGYRASRYASSACHLMGVPVSSSETFTWLHNPVFRATPLDMKAEADLHFLQGINQIICHGWPYTPPQVANPGWSFYVGGAFGDRNPWYIAMTDVNTYLTRVSAMLRQGHPANDVAVYLANDDAWAHFTPGHISLTDGLGEQLGSKIVGQILDSGYNLDFFDDQMLERFGRVDGNAMAFGDLRYKVIVLAGVERIPLSTYRKLETIARAGGVVVATRRLPDTAPGYLTTDADTAEVRAISDRLFKAPGAPGVFVEDESNLTTALSARMRPDVKLLPASPQIGIVHRHTDFAEIYFLANTSNQPIQITATFRIEGANPQQWDPLTASTKPLPIADHPPGGTSIAISLQPYGSTFIIWSKKRNAASATSNTISTLSPIDLSADWTVQFGDGAKPVPMPALKSWTDNPATKFYSGVCTYTRRVELSGDQLSQGGRIKMTFGSATPLSPEGATARNAPKGFHADLAGPVRDAAVVYINNERAGAVWCPPYELDVTDYLKPGRNDIRIQVANTNVNAIAQSGFPNYDYNAVKQKFGDRFTPVSEKEFQPVTSGLLGPIQLRMDP